MEKHLIISMNGDGSLGTVRFYNTLSEAINGCEFQSSKNTIELYYKNVVVEITINKYYVNMGKFLKKKDKLNMVEAQTHFINLYDTNPQVRKLFRQFKLEKL